MPNPKLKRIPKKRQPRPKGLQCKHIPTWPILKFIAEHRGTGCHWWNLPGKNERSVVNAIPYGPLLSPRLIHAKMRHLIYKGLVDGSLVGRGDFKLTDNGRRAYLAHMPHPIAANTNPPVEIIKYLFTECPMRTYEVRFAPEHFPNGDHGIGISINGAEYVFSIDQITVLNGPVVNMFQQFKVRHAVGPLTGRVYSYHFMQTVAHSNG